MIKPLIIGVLTELLKFEPRREITGFLLAYQNEEQELVRVRNLSMNQYSFFIADSDIDDVKRYALKNNTTIYAFVHSHNGTTDMSEHDKMTFESSEFNWIIIALYEEQLKWQFYSKKQKILK